MKLKITIVWISTMFVLAGSALSAQDDPALKSGFYPEQFSRMKNPLPFNYKTLALGRKVYNDQQCTSCHGVNGDGKGDAAVVGRFMPMPRDFTTAAVMEQKTDGMLFYSISKGVHGTWMMPREHLLTEKDRWAVIHYIRTFAAPEQEGDKPEAKEKGDQKK